MGSAQCPVPRGNGPLMTGAAFGQTPGIALVTFMRHCWSRAATKSSIRTLNVALPHLRVSKSERSVDGC